MFTKNFLVRRGKCFIISEDIITTNENILLPLHNNCRFRKAFNIFRNVRNQYIFMLFTRKIRANFLLLSLVSGTCLSNFYRLLIDLVQPVYPYLGCKTIKHFQFVTHYDTFSFVSFTLSFSVMKFKLTNKAKFRNFNVNIVNLTCL